MSIIKSWRILLTAGATVVCLAGPRAVAADPQSAAPTVVPQDGNASDALRNLKGVPDNVKTLVVNFDTTRDRYLKQQQSLLTKLHTATTEDERKKVRDLLQDNRQNFLTDLKTFREQLRDDMKDLKNKISHGEFQRVIDAAGGSGKSQGGGGNPPGRHHHKGP